MIQMIQIIEQTKEEEIAMYMKCTKKELISMLMENQRMLAQRIRQSRTKSKYHNPNAVK
jgi:hypothetical protein